MFLRIEHPTDPMWIITKTHILFEIKKNEMKCATVTILHTANQTHIYTLPSLLYFETDAPVPKHTGSAAEQQVSGPHTVTLQNPGYKPF